nr:MAG TPA: hypothetical protein [Caudoviricetes sp.]
MTLGRRLYNLTYIRHTTLPILGGLFCCLSRDFRVTIYDKAQ